MARFMKQLIPVNIPDTYTIDPMFIDIAHEEEIRQGILTFREFLHQLCDGLLDDSSLCDIPKKGKKKYSDDTTLTVEFPFLNNIRSLLLNIGQFGVLSETGDSLLIKDWDKLSLKRSLNKNSTTKISNAQMLKSIHFLTECGLAFDGIDLSVKKPDLSRTESINITYPTDPVMLTGWKVLGIAQNEFSSRKNDDILLRCDYRMLSKEVADVTSFMDDFVEPLPESVQDFVLNMHHHCLEAGMKCTVELGFFCVHLIYTHKKKAVWRFSTSLHNGYRMVLKTKNTHKYGDVVDGFSPSLRDTIHKGYGCDRKEGTSHGNCTNGCEGFKFSLDESLLDISSELELWLDSELASMQRKK